MKSSFEESEVSSDISVWEELCRGLLVYEFEVMLTKKDEAHSLIVQYQTGFFKPIKKINDFRELALAPALLPLALSLRTVEQVLIAAAGTISCVISLMLAVGASVFDRETSKKALSLSLNSSVNTAVALSAIVLSAVLFIAQLPLALVKLATRSLSTIASPIFNGSTDAVPRSEFKG